MDRLSKQENSIKSSQKWIFLKCLFAVILLTLFRLSVTFHRQAIETSSLSVLISERTEVENERIREYERLNIVLFYADDWTMQVLGKLNPLVQTPNIDKMADNGMIFTDNCITTSVCWISRASLMTGLYAARHKQTTPWGTLNMYKLHPWNETMFPLLKSHGYYTGLVGKWHSHSPNPEMRMAFDYQNIYYGHHWEGRKGKRRHVTDLNLEDSLEFLRKRPKKKNFALKVSFFATHAWDNHYPSYEPMNKSKALLYNDITIPMPKTNTEKHYNELPHFFKGINAGRARWKKRFEPDYYQQSIKDLYRMATEVDFAVGKVIKELKKQGVYDKTMLIFTTDNGNLHGEHGLAEKWFPFEESIKVPLVIQDPRMPKVKHGTSCDKFTLNIDLAPTILGAAKIKPSSFFQGRDIADLYLGRGAKWRKDFFYEFYSGVDVDPLTAENHTWKNDIDASFALVTKEWKYIYWPQQNYEQLFNRRLDPFDELDLLTNTSTFKAPEGVYYKMQARYNFLKRWAQSGRRV